MSETEYNCDDCDADCQEIQRAKCRPAHLCQIRELQSENEDLQAGINCGAARYDKLWNERVELKAENKWLRDAMEKIETAQIANMKPNSVALYQMFVKETAAQALGRKVKEHDK